MNLTGPYRDGKLYVLSEMCATCVFRPGNLMHLSAGRLRDLVDSNVRSDAAITCHSTLPYGKHPEAGEAVCRGFYDRHKTTPLQLAERLDMIGWQEPPTSP